MCRPIPRFDTTSTGNRRLAVLVAPLLVLGAASVVSVAAGAASGTSTHQVHNLVLYPHRHSWCEARPVEQVIQHQHCTSKVIDNNICVGQCFSYTVPRTIPEEPGDDALHYCDTCRPQNYTWTKVKLSCDGSEAGAGTESMEFLVEVISTCACALCRESPHDETDGDGETPGGDGEGEEEDDEEVVEEEEEEVEVSTAGSVTTGDGGSGSKKVAHHADAATKSKHHSHRHHHGLTGAAAAAAVQHPDTYLHGEEEVVGR